MRIDRLHKCLWTVLLPALLTSAGILMASPSPEKSSFEKIDRAYQAGQISQSAMLVQKMAAFFGPENLAMEFQSSAPSRIKSGTEIIRAVLVNWGSFSPEQQSQLSQFLARPGKQAEFASPGGNFSFHYDTLGPEAVPPQDLNSNLIPDFVERAALYCDSAEVVVQGQLAYLPVPTDNSAGGDNRYDIYFLAIGGYGATVPEASGDSAWDDASSFIMLHHTFLGFPPNNDPEGDSIGAAKVTCAHEYFHASQLAYDRFEDLWWMEATATWIEDVIFPEVDDNYNYLSYYYSTPETRLSLEGSYHMYAAFIWPSYLEQKYGQAIIKDIWQNCRYFSAFPATDTVLKPLGKSLGQIFPEFALWNYYTGSRSVIGQYYADAGDYPEADIDIAQSSLAVDSLEPVHRPGGLACNYLSFTVDPSAHGICELRLDGSPTALWALTAIFTKGGVDTAITSFSIAGAPAKIDIPYIEDYSQVMVIPMVINHSGNNEHYYLSAIIPPHGDANYDRKVNVGDVTYVINHSFKNGPAPLPLWQSGDANCDDRVNVADAVRLLNFVFKGASAPCTP